MRPFYFGPPGGEVFGIHHAPERERARNAGVVLCYPFGFEYRNVFRAFRILATRLAREGFDVLRFDYFGSGDSAGESGEGSVEQWISDIKAAVVELKGVRRVGTVSLVGVHLGATLAAMAGADLGDVERLVLWEPVVQGDEYIAALLGRQREWLEAEIEQRSQARGLASEDEVLGYPLTKTMRQDLERLCLATVETRPARHVLIIWQDGKARDIRVAARLLALYAHVDERWVEVPNSWATDPGMTVSLVPNEVLNTILHWLGGSEA